MRGVYTAGVLDAFMEHDIEFGRLEKNPKKAQEIYDIGYQDGLKSIEKVKELLEG